VLIDDRFPIDRLPFREPHNLQNACMAGLMAWAVLDRMSRPRTDCIFEGLRGFRGLAHRMEEVGSRGGVRLINNSMCTNPDAVIKSVQSVRDRTHILMGGVNKGLDFGPLKHYLANHRHRVYLFGRNARELREMLGDQAQVFADMQEAFAAAASNATEGDVIMLAPGCASSDMFQDFRERGNVFKAIATDWLRS
jgi:UDP-N-acetylmuramoylalanine--D-glutamate ligase